MSDSAAPVGLRERRRQETARDVSDAAIVLFEQQGVHATTVDDIAAAAGISQRTFFRYFATKEQAAFLEDPDGDLLTRATMARIEAGDEPAEALEAGWLAVFDHFASDETGRRRGRRVHSLIHSEPTLLAIALRRDAEQARNLADAIALARDTDPAGTYAQVVVFATLARQAFEQWARRADAGEARPVREIYRGLREALRPLGRFLAD